MNKLQKWISLLLCACMLTGAVAFAEVTTPVASTAVELQGDTVIAIVNGTNILWSDAQSDFESLVSEYGSYYDMTVSENINLFRAVALENAILKLLIQQQATERGLDKLTEEETAALNAASNEDWDMAMDNYATSNLDITAESTAEEKSQAITAAEVFFQEMGYTREILHELYLKQEIESRLQKQLTQDTVVTDEDVEADYQQKVENDKVLYEDDISAYIEYNSYVDQMAMYAMFYGSGNEMDYAWYKPAGFRAVKHILLPVDEVLMNEYNELQSKLEEQMNDEAVSVQGGEAPDAAEADTSEEATVPVTQEDVDTAQANILASLRTAIDEINAKIAEGADFDELIATYAVKADGTPTDGGMTAEPYKTSGYEVALESTNYVGPFVKATFSVDNIGDVSAPYLSEFGVHIVKYIADVPAGPVAMTPEQREASRAALLESKKSDLYSSALMSWMDAAQIEYTGIIPNVAELETAEDDAEAEDIPVADEAEEAPAE